MSSKKYVLFASLAYAFPILRPLEREIRRRGGEAAWFLEPGCPEELEPDEVRLRTVREVVDYNPLAVITCVDYMFDFFPGVKVDVFHGYAINKRNTATDAHFRVRGYFDVYCTQGPATTSVYRELERRCGYFRVYETGWPKADLYFSPEMQRRPRNERPVILYSSTFTRGLTSAPVLADEVERLVREKDWEWIFMFHPKLSDPAVLGRYERIAAGCDHATFLGNTFSLDAMRRADAMLCDSSSVILEFMFLDKPVVTFRNSHPGPYLLDVREPEEVGPALERALTRPEGLMRAVREYTLSHEAHRDGLCSARVLDAIDDYLARGREGLRRKPMNLLRKWKMRRKLHYYPLLEKLKNH